MAPRFTAKEYVAELCACAARYVIVTVSVRLTYLRMPQSVLALPPPSVIASSDAKQRLLSNRIACGPSFGAATAIDPNVAL
ncbi:hypothetical protein WPS_05600 [Vulcanimicrobium alpinum]|uniref:Uncharacterized protein n=1 Tax=Vulcanimicrobium alpinum TaxID=3016050 RepID=A0AAN1XTD7_UNVUL|nr:hypothetical protein WPS_05600 [Vulcanimicrobium alpinum]